VHLLKIVAAVGSARIQIGLFGHLNPIHGQHHLPTDRWLADIPDLLDLLRFSLPLGPYARKYNRTGLISGLGGVFVLLIRRNSIVRLMRARHRHLSGL